VAHADGSTQENAPNLRPIAPGSDKQNMYWTAVVGCADFGTFALFPDFL